MITRRSLRNGQQCSPAPFRSIGTLLLLLLTLGVQQGLADPCAAMTDCSSCSNSSSVCHWCGSDNKCHTIGSPYGCITGVNCYNNQACVRQAPQPTGHAPPGAGVIVAVCVFILTSLLLLGACYFFVNEFVNHATITRVERDASYQELVRFEQKEEHFMQNASYRLMAEEEQWDPIPRVKVTHTPRFIKIVMWTARALVFGVLAFLMTIAVFVLMYSPHIPGINVCNTELDWGSIFSGFSKLKLEADYQLLLSVHNPNRLDVAITSGQGVFKHDHTPIGSVEFPSFVIKGGAITDVLVTMVFTPSVWKGLQLDLEFQSQSLTLMVDMGVSGQVLWNRLPVYPFSYSMQNYFIHVGMAGDRSLCHCQPWQ